MLQDARRAFLSGLVDYAGLFPPADLGMEEALANYASDRVGDEAWMLQRFIVPAARLGEIDPGHPRFGEGGPLRLSVLGLRGDADDWEGSFSETLRVAAEYEATHAGAAILDRFETPLTPDLARRPDRLAAALIAVANQSLAVRSAAALEVPILNGADAAEPVAHAVAEANRTAGRPAFMLKFRCGGVTPGSFPSVESLATAITAARHAGVPFKATAGLHHPFRRHADEVDAVMHGFVNVFGGATLAAVHDLGADDLAEILDDQNSSSWTLAEDLGWNSLTAAASRVEEARSHLALSFGSCSFDDPRLDLRAVGWL